MKDELFPSDFIISAGGFLGPSFSVSLENEVLVYRYLASGVPHTPDEIRYSTPTDDQWRRFWADVRDLGVWNWRRSYDNLEVLDGVQWEVGLAVGDKRVKSSGSNAYPPRYEMACSKEFRALLRAVGELMNDRELASQWCLDAES